MALRKPVVLWGVVFLLLAGTAGTSYTGTEIQAREPSRKTEKATSAKEKKQAPRKESSRSKDSRKNNPSKPPSSRKKVSAAKPVPLPMPAPCYSPAPEGLGRFAQAFSHLPALDLKKSAFQRAGLSALVKLGDSAVLIDGLSMRITRGGWLLDEIKAVDSGGGNRLTALAKAGVMPMEGPKDADSFLQQLPQKIRSKKWDDILLDSTWKRDPKSHSLVNDIEEDQKVCGPKGYQALLGKLPPLGNISAAIWMLSLKLEPQGEGAGFVDLAIVPTEKGFRLARLRVICN